MTDNPEPWENTNAFTGDNQQFTYDNWNDPFINLFREAFAPAEHTETPSPSGSLPSATNGTTTRTITSLKTSTNCCTS